MWYEEAGQFTDSATNGDREAESVGKLISVEKTQLNIVKGRTVLDYMKASGGYCTAITSLLTFFLAVTAQNSANVFLMYWLNQGSGVRILTFLCNLIIENFDVWFSFCMLIKLGSELQIFWRGKQFVQIHSTI